MATQDLLENMIQELKRGTQIMIVLSALKDMQYGYSLLQVLNEKNVNIEAGTLYPLLRRLDQQGLLDSIWDTTESRPRKYYKLSENGAEILKALKKAWEDMVNDVNQSLKEI
ncbi:PadR family transcriptional regulator [Tenericutes bacterium MO-XQ]|jgi:DNA-binding PadR family transcriptional regulator|nr:PadR family transcriptional regulator [Tenericutes bacterium MO-XQ]